MEQDWKTVVIKKNTSNQKPKTQQQIAQAKAKGDLSSEKKMFAGTNKAHKPPRNAAQIESEQTDFKHQEITLDFKLALMRARQEKKLTQAQLANLINVKQTVINDYESGKAIPDQQLISKLNRALGVRLPKLPKKKKHADDE